MLFIFQPLLQRLRLSSLNYHMPNMNDSTIIGIVVVLAFTIPAFVAVVYVLMRQPQSPRPKEPVLVRHRDGRLEVVRR
jgi:hypothetical protein